MNKQWHMPVIGAMDDGSCSDKLTTGAIRQAGCLSYHPTNSVKTLNGKIHMSQITCLIHI